MRHEVQVEAHALGLAVRTQRHEAAGADEVVVVNLVVLKALEPDLDCYQQLLSHDPDVESRGRAHTG